MYYIQVSKRAQSARSSSVCGICETAGLTVNVKKKRALIVATPSSWSMVRQVLTRWEFWLWTASAVKVKNKIGTHRRVCTKQSRYV